jgi:hypothetical protein
VLIQCLDLFGLHDSFIETGLYRNINFQPLPSLLNLFLKFNELMFVGIELHLLFSLSEGRNELTASSTHDFCRIT